MPAAALNALLSLLLLLLLLLLPFSADGWEAAGVGLNDFTSTARALLLLLMLLLLLLLLLLLPLTTATAAVADDAALLKSSSADNTRVLRPMTRVATAPSLAAAAVAELPPLELLSTRKLETLEGRGALCNCYNEGHARHKSQVSRTCRSDHHSCCCCCCAKGL